MKTPRKKYQNDPDYQSLVNTLYSLIDYAKFTPSEIREAALYACILHEERTTRSVVSPKVLNALETLNQWNGKKS